MKQEDLKVLLYFAEERGDESCGVATTKTVLKKAEDPHEFIVRSLPVDKTVLGHTRQATCGSVTDKNSHPFTSGGIVGVHNGAISNFRALQRKEKTNFKVDSEIIWHLISKYGLEEALPKLKGWLALGWIDERDRLNLYRHSAPLHIGYRDDNLFFASRDEYLEAIDCEDIEKIEEWHHYVIEEGEIVEDNDLSAFKLRPNYRTYSGYNRGGQNTQDNEEDKEEEEDTDESGYPKPDNVPDMANFTVSNNPPGVAYYHWFGMSNTNELYVQPSAPLFEDFVPPLCKFLLTDKHEVARLERNYPDVFSDKDVYSKIERHIGKFE